MADVEASRIEHEPPAPLRPVAPTVGTVAAGLVLAALFLSGPGTDATVRALPLAALARGSALAAVLAFVVRRRVDVPDRPVGGVAVAAGLVVVAGDLLTLFGELNVWRQPAGLPVATAAAVPVVGMGMALVLGLPERRVFTVTRGVGVATALGAVGFVATAVGGAVLLSLVTPLVGTSGIAVRYPVFTVTTAVSAVAFVAVALQQLGKDRSWIDASVPTLRDVGLAVASLAVLLVAVNGLTALIAELGLPSVESSVEQQASEAANPEFLLVLVPLSVLAIAPSEELLYRGLVQKYLYDYVGKRWAVVAASAIFAAVHFSQYASPDPLRMAVSLSVVFVLSLVLGYSYARSENLVVPVLVHGAFNAVTFLAMYARVTGMVG